MKFKMAAMAAGLLCMVACVTVTTFTREPLVEDDCLVIGRVELDCYLTRTGSLPIGHYRYNVKLEFVDMESNRMKQVTTVDPKGFFYIYNPESSRFFLKRMHYTQYHVQPELHPQKGKPKIKLPKSATASIKPKRKIVFTLQRNNVNNLGLIEWRANMRDGKHEVTHSQAHAETRQEFANKYPESLWAQREWVNIFAEDEFYNSSW